MPFLNEPTSKTSHAEFIDNPDIEALVENSTYITEPTAAAAKALADGFVSAAEFELHYPLPEMVFASDGSFYEASLDKRYPSTKVGYVKVSSLILDVAKYASLGTGSVSRFIDPVMLNKLEEMTNALALSLPSSNLRYQHAESVVDGFRMKLFEEFSHRKTELPTAGRMIQTLFRMATMPGCPTRHGVRTPDGAMAMFVSKCPRCEYAPGINEYNGDGFVLLYSEGPRVCPSCDATIYATDALRLYETVTDHGGLAGGLSRIMNVAEYLLLAHTLLDCAGGDSKETLSRLCFIVDGPLAFFGQPAWLHRPMQFLINRINRMLTTERGLPPMMMVGIQKQGALADHAKMIAKFLPRGSFRFVDDVYRNRYISPVSQDKNFGDEVYFGQDLIFHTKKGNIFVLGTPYPFDNKSGGSFKVEKALVKNYDDLGRLFSLVELFESDLYGGSLVPVIIAHRHASISRVPGGKVLDVAAQLKFADGALNSSTS